VPVRINEEEKREKILKVNKKLLPAFIVHMFVSFPTTAHSYSCPSTCFGYLLLPSSQSYNNIKTPLACPMLYIL
jgi:hypothetical protein